jgi:hypothetical protein
VAKWLASGSHATAVFPGRLKLWGSFVCLVGTGAPCYPATPTDNAIRDQRGWFRFLVVTTDYAQRDFWLFIRTRAGGFSWSIRTVVSR